MASSKTVDGKTYDKHVARTLPASVVGGGEGAWVIDDKVGGECGVDDREGDTEVDVEGVEVVDEEEEEDGQGEEATTVRA